MRLEVGDIVKTNYGTGPYDISHILRDCTCPKYLDSIEMENPPASKPHIHLTCRDPENPRRLYWLNGYDERTLKSVWSPDDCLIYCGQNKSVQLSLF